MSTSSGKRTTTEAARRGARRPRLSRRALRAWAWIAAALGALAPAVAIGLNPQPSAAGPERPVVIRRVIRRIVIQPVIEEVPARVVYVGGGSSSAGSGSSSSVSAPAAPPVSSGGS